MGGPEKCRECQAPLPWESPGQTQSSIPEILAKGFTPRHRKIPISAFSSKPFVRWDGISVSLKEEVVEEKMNFHTDWMNRLFCPLRELNYWSQCTFWCSLAAQRYKSTSPDWPVCAEAVMKGTWSGRKKLETNQTTDVTTPVWIYLTSPQNKY